MTPRRKTENCMSGLTLDRWVAGELAADDQRAARDHVATCTSCRARWEAISNAQRTFAETGPKLTFPAAPASDRRPAMGARGRPSPLVLVPLLAAAAAFALLLGQRHFAVDHGAGAERTKGQMLDYYVLRNREVVPGPSLPALHPGDDVQFVFSAPRSGYLAILSIDGAGKVSVYFPSGERAAPFGAGSALPVPASTVLDDTLGKERIFAFFCDTAMELEPLRKKLEASVKEPPTALGCEVHTLTYRKERP
jgi:hypothetical protein